MRYHPGLWTAILAGGEGTRMQRFIRECFATDTPKQFCAFFGRRAMVEYAMDWASALADPERLLILSRAGLGEYLDPLVPPALNESVLEQPEDRGTLAAVLASCVHAMTQDPKAILLVLPSDSFAYPDSRIIRNLSVLAEEAAARPDQIVILGIRPDTFHADFGWICLDGAPGEASGMRQVGMFREKPSEEEGRELYDRLGALANTGIFAGRAETILKLGLKACPALWKRFRALQKAALAVRDDPDFPQKFENLLSDTYSDIPKMDFYSAVLQRFPQRCAVLQMHDLIWSDLGVPERVAELMTWMAYKPNYSVERMSSPFAGEGLAGQAPTYRAEQRQGADSPPTFFQ